MIHFWIAREMCISEHSLRKRWLSVLELGSGGVRVAREEWALPPTFAEELRRTWTLWAMVKRGMGESDSIFEFQRT